ncbi:MAG: type IV toxin-antitoxin system AbiEi family antitoxin domain-containing protein [Propionibacteriaceae bacterium]|nr:type IV toxin-antitoxin system AbiEi family antitoxin domain-containing protein [Propionibacteriaceae bacterium]
MAGVFSKEQLRQMGWDERQLRDALESGVLTRVARGWYAHPTAEAAAVSAVRAGGRLGCLSGCRTHGLWTPHHREPHIVLGRNTEGRLRLGWHRHHAPLPSEALFPLADCLAQVIKHHSAEEALTVLESAVNQKKITASDARLLIGDASVQKQRTLKFFDPRAQSGSETKVRLFLQQMRVPVKSQVHIPGVGWVDHLVGNSYILECDSDEFHRDRGYDYTRDLGAHALGYDSDRLSYAQIHYEWGQTTQYLVRKIRTRRHLRMPVPI